MFYVELPPNIGDHKKYWKKDWKCTVFCQQLAHTVWCNKTVQNYYMSNDICEQLPLPVQLFSSVQCGTKAWNLWLLVLILSVIHGTIQTWDILLLLQRSLLSPFSRWSDYPVTYGTGTEPQTGGSTSASPTKGEHFLWYNVTGSDLLVLGKACVQSTVWHVSGARSYNGTPFGAHADVL